MHPQRALADVEHDVQPRQTRRERFPRRMDARLPWARLEARIRLVYPTGERGRSPYPLALRLRIHCVQLFDNLSDPAMKDALDDSVAVQRFVGLTARDPRPRSRRHTNAEASDTPVIRRFPSGCPRHGRPKRRPPAA